MSIHPVLKPNGFSDVEHKVRELQRAASLFWLIGDIGVEAAHSGTALSLDDMRGISSSIRCSTARGQDSRTGAGRRSRHHMGL
jgi:hypothetical protein